MLKNEVLELLRCPIDPAREAKLLPDDALHLACEKCPVQFRLKDGFPILIAEEAILPEGMKGLKDLSCRKRRSSGERR